MSKLSRIISEVEGVDIDNVEEFLIKQHSPNRKKNKFHHFSRHALSRWYKGRRMEALERMAGGIFRSLSVLLSFLFLTLVH